MAPPMPETGFPWTRFRRLVRWMALVSLTAVAVTLVLFYREFGPISVHFYLATALGVGFATMLMAVLMGLVFVSNSSGHDAAASDHSDGSDSR
jgi:hypothetical protein